MSGSGILTNGTLWLNGHRLEQMSIGAHQEVPRILPPELLQFNHRRVVVPGPGEPIRHVVLSLRMADVGETANPAEGDGEDQVVAFTSAPPEDPDWVALARVREAGWSGRLRGTWRPPHSQVGVGVDMHHVKGDLQFAGFDLLLPTTEDLIMGLDHPGRSLVGCTESAAQLQELTHFVSGPWPVLFGRWTTPSGFSHESGFSKEEVQIEIKDAHLIPIPREPASTRRDAGRNSHTSLARDTTLSHTTTRPLLSSKGPPLAPG